MTEVEKVKEVEKEEREKIRESIRLRKEKQKLGQFEKATVECPECGSHILVHDYERAELVCNKCGLVVDADFIDHGPEWMAYDEEQRKKLSRVGAPMTYTVHDKGLSTMIDWRNRDSYGKSISSMGRAQLYHLRKWQRRIRLSNATGRNLAFALSELARMESAFISAQIAARAVFESGISKEAFEKYYYPLCNKMFITDNLYGQMLFKLNHIISSHEILSIAHMDIARKDERKGHQHLDDIQWNMFTGHESYKNIFWDFFEPKLQLELGIEVMKEILERLRKKCRLTWKQ